MASKTYDVGYVISKLGDDVDIVFSEKGFTPNQYYNDINENGINLTISGPGSSGVYNSDGTISLYTTSDPSEGYGEITISSKYSTYNIKTVTLYFTVDSGGSLRIGQGTISSGYPVTVNSQSATVYLYRTSYSGSAYISRIVVTYE